LEGLARIFKIDPDSAMVVNLMKRSETPISEIDESASGRRQ
jgi:hypothetical protein